mmetsp:Transcript_31621/g.48363  ORF Transcript_31621/g.48363 Transcript_31621/m.48363 type:complete len:147 (+) Transcript_31621:528-968(+)
MTLGAIGSDGAGKLVESQLQQEDLVYHIHKEDNTLTGQCAVTVNDGDRTCIAVLDACEAYPASHIESVLARPEVQSCKAFYTTGFFVESNFKACQLMAEHALKNNRLFCFNFAAEYLFESRQAEILEMLEFSDFVFCNRDEAFAAT